MTETYNKKKKAKRKKEPLYLELPELKETVIAIINKTILQQRNLITKQL
jgi:hypothetical protein